MTNQYGPWASLIDAGGNPQLSAFWRRRLTMLVPTSQTSPALSRRNLIWLVAGAVAVCALPTIRGASVLAEQPKNSEKAAEQSQTAPDHAKQVLDSFEKQFSAVRGLRFSGSTKSHVRVDMAAALHSPPTDFVVAFDRSQGRWRVAEDGVMTLMPSGVGTSERKVHLETEVTVKGRKYLAAHRENGARVGLMSETNASDREIWHWLSGESYPLALGYLPGVGDLPNALRKMKVSVRPDVLDGVPVEVLRGKSAELELVLWLDPKCNFAARRITYQRSRDHVEVGDIAECACNVGAFREKEGHFFPVSYRIDLIP